MITSTWFSESEFRKASPSCSLQNMKQSTMDRFDLARQYAGIPFVFNSAYRSYEWERSKGRSGTGAHPLGQALDIRATTDSSRGRVLIGLIMAGFTRIGIARTYIHADDSLNHSQKVAWLY